MRAQDSLGDYIELKASVPSITAEMVHTNQAVSTVLKLCLLSEGLAADGSFAVVDAAAAAAANRIQIQEFTSNSHTRWKRQ